MPLADVQPDNTPRGRYDQATRALAANKAADAAKLLDGLTAEFPRAAEYFAARASAMLQLKSALYASADAQYALALKPELISTRYVLAVAEEQLNHPAQAAYHYRLYADSKSPDVRPDLQAEATRRADRLSPRAQPVPPPSLPPTPQPYVPPQQPQYAPQPQAYVPPAQPAPSCRMGTDGRQACGYNCRMGTDGVMVCADTPDGACAMGTDGRVTCSQLGRGAMAPSGGPPPSCRMGTDGQNVCGYNCQMGTNGHMYCASRPDGRCAFNTNGTFSCP